MIPPVSPHSLEVDVLAEALKTDLRRGLNEEEVRRRQESFGFNRLIEARPLSGWEIFARQFRGAMVYLLASAALISLSLQEWLDAGAIVVVIVINSLIGFATEFRAEKAVEALKKMTTTRAKVIREGILVDVDGEDLVPGDLLVVEAGDIIAADGRLLTAASLAVDESSLTGESLPVEKDTVVLDEATGLADRHNCIHAGTASVRGTGQALVVATGMGTEIGRISRLLVEVEEGTTPLQERLGRFTGFMIRGVMAVALLVFALGTIQGRGFLPMIQTGIALAVAAVPEGLPIVATMALAFGVSRMARLNALVRNLSAVETLGSTTVICTDKTGTITLNEMTVKEVVILSEKARPLLRRVAVLCNNAALEGEKGVGDPMEVALLRFAASEGELPSTLRSNYPRLAEEPFDSTTMRMVTRHGEGVALKGAPERLLADLTRVHDGTSSRPLGMEERIWWSGKVEDMARRGMRTIALAWGESGEETALVGLLGIVDPPRPEVSQSIQKAREAGIHTIMITGDHLGTAQAVARQVGLSDSLEESLSGDSLDAIEEERLSSVLLRTHVIARVVPEQKLRIVQALQRAGEVVAMTGDGVNDAVALKQADVGVAMGIQGTEVSKEASDIILQDDHFETIVQAVAEGRRIFANISKAILFLISCNLSEVVTVSTSILLRLPSVLLPLQILWINLITDVLPALSLSLDPAEPQAMTRGPRRREEDLLSRRDVRRMILYGVLLSLGALASYGAFLKLFPQDDFRAREAAFHTLVLAQLFFVFNVREACLLRHPSQLWTNQGLWVGVLASLFLQVAVTFSPLFQKVLAITPFSAREWVLVLAFSLFPTTVIQIAKAVKGD